MAAWHSTSDALLASARVLTEPALLRCITSFQRGLPVSLYVFWVQHDPSLLQSKDPNLIRNASHRLLQLVIQHGTVDLLEELLAVKIYIRSGSSVKCHTVSLFSLSHHVFESNRVDMVQWALATNKLSDSIGVVWWLAIKHHRDGDHRVLDVLRVQKPIDVKQLAGLTDRIDDVDLARWLDHHFDLPVNRKLMDHATSQGNVAMVKYLFKHHPTVNFGTWPFENATKRGHFDVLRCLFEDRPEQINRGFIKRLITQGHKPVMQTLVDVGGFEDVAREVAKNFVFNDRVEDLERLLDDGLLPSGKPFSIDHAAMYGKLNVIKFLTERNLATATTLAMDGAAVHKHWDVVMYLHENRDDGCTTLVMDAAAAQGRIEEVQFLHENRSEGCSTQAMDDAAGAGALLVVKFLHENRSEGCTTRAMDTAAGNGYLHVVTFLHEKRSEGCTTDAMDCAAAGGHLSIVRFLQSNRTEGCTVDGIRKALRNGYVEVVSFLYAYYQSLFGPQLLYDLLLHGAFDIWMKLRERHLDEANAVVEPVLFDAGAQGELATISFIVRELGRDDLAHVAVDGAATSTLHNQAQWLRAVFVITGPRSCSLTAVRNAVVFTRPKGEPTAIQFLVSVCSDAGASEVAIADARESMFHYSLYRKLAAWVENGRVLELPPVHPLLLDPRCPGWVVQRVLGDCEPFSDPYQRCEQPVPWAVQAIYRGDRTLLEILQDLQVNDPVFGFEGARAAAIRAGNLPLLQWLLSNIKLQVEPTLLNEALSYHQFEIAEWLAANCLDGCREFNWDTKVDVSRHYPCGPVDEMLLAWIEDHATVRDIVDFGGVAYHSRVH